MTKYEVEQYETYDNEDGDDADDDIGWYVEHPNDVLISNKYVEDNEDCDHDNDNNDNEDNGCEVHSGEKFTFDGHMFENCHDSTT